MFLEQPWTVVELWRLVETDSLEAMNSLVASSFLLLVAMASNLIAMVSP